MATLVPIGFDKVEPLDKLNDFVAQQEEQFGPLIGIGNDGSTQTVLTFDMDQDPPTNHAVIVPAGGSASWIYGHLPGSSLYCRKLDRRHRYSSQLNS